MSVLVDTSAWSMALRKNKINSEKHKVELKLTQLIEQHTVCIIGPIRQEILSGISNELEFMRLKVILEAFIVLKIETAIYVRAAKMYNQCRRKGVQGSHIDFLICAAAEFFSLSIFTLDKDFICYSKYLPIVLEKAE